MPLIVILILLAAIAAFAWATPATRAAVQRRPGAFLFGGLVLVVVILVSFRTGRHWLGVIATAALVWGPRLLPWLGLLSRRAAAATGNGPGRPPGVHRMTRDEALEVLGLAEGATEEEILSRYRSLMKTVHPDRGGSGYLAKRVNEAKRILLDGSR
jgi:DnaJ homolog subfamily C member 19